MKISTDSERTRFNKQLGEAAPGSAIEFKRVPHQKHTDGDIFLVLRVPSQYIKETERRNEDQVFRIMVANLATGDCSLVIQSRAVRFVNAEVVKNEN